MISLITKPKYKNFIDDRDKFLDDINHRNRLQISDVLRRTFSHVTYMIESIYRKFEDSQFNYGHLKQMLMLIETGVDHMLSAARDEIVQLQKQNRKEIYDFTYASETAAIGRVKGKVSDNLKPHPTSHHDTPSGGSLDARIGLTFDKLKRNILTAVQQSAITDEPTKDMMIRVLKKLPEVKRVQNPKRHLKPMQAFSEAQAPSVKVTTGIVDDPTWDSMLDKYKNDYVPKFRGPESVIGGKELATEPYNEYYAWELEQELTEDFVNQVRLGQVQAGKDNGVEDFMWVAIVDSKTDDCCLERDGLSSSEIQDKLDSGDLDDECDAVTPPAHFFCRCTLSPMTDYLPEAPESDIGEFDDWLSS